MDFVRYFVCFERTHPKHAAAVRASGVPVLVESFGKWSVVCGGEAHGYGPIADVFGLWVDLAVEPHGLDLSDLRHKLNMHAKPTSDNSIYEMPVC